MIGRDLKALYTRAGARRPGEALLEVDRPSRTAHLPGPGGRPRVRHGEILGLAGLVGSGRTELARAIFGIDRASAAGPHRRRAGRRSQRRATRSPRHLSRAGGPQAVRPAARLVDRAEHLAARSRAPTPARPDRRRAAEEANAEAQQTQARHPHAHVADDVGALSGGNQQKVVLAKWLAMSPRVMIFDEPTRGIDIGAKTEIYGLMRALADAGVAVLMISSDMEEVIGVCDRIAVMHEGRIAGFLDRAAVQRGERCWLLAVGQSCAADNANNADLAEQSGR